jgi:hypothetical protein
MLVDGLTVNAQPAIDGLLPPLIGQGAISWPFAATGSGFLQGLTLDLGPGITVSGLTITPTRIDALVSVAGDATIGERDVTVRNDNQGAPAVCVAATETCLSIGARPTFSALSPSSRGAGGFDQVLEATGTGIIEGATLDLGPGVVAVNHEDVHATRVDIEVDIAHGAAQGPRDATLVNGDGGRSLPLDDGFTILQPPVIDDVDPAQLVRGANTMTITGTNFDANVVVSAGPGVTTGTTTVNPGGTVITVPVTVSNSAPIGIRDVRVTNADDAGSDLCLGCTGIGDPGQAVLITSRGFVSEGAVFEFFDRVRDVRASNVQIREADGTVVPMVMACTDLGGAVEPCTTSDDIRRIALRPVGHLIPGERYVAFVNPTGVATKVRTGAGVLALASKTFIGYRNVQERSDAVDLLWQPVSHGSAAGDRYVRESRAGASIRTTFVGDKVTWITPIGPSFGVARVLVDGAVVDNEVDTSANRDAFGSRFTYDGFGAGSHVLELVVLGDPGAFGPSGAFVALDGIIDQRDRFLNPSARSLWSLRSEPIVESATIAVGSLAGERAMMEFRGTAVRIGLIGGPDGGIAEVLVDGASLGDADLYSRPTTLQTLTVTGLTDGRHVVTLRVSGRKNRNSSGRVVRLDYFGARG